MLSSSCRRSGAGILSAEGCWQGKLRRREQNIVLFEKEKDCRLFERKSFYSWLSHFHIWQWIWVCWGSLQLKTKCHLPKISVITRRNLLHHLSTELSQNVLWAPIMLVLLSILQLTISFQQHMWVQKESCVRSDLHIRQVELLLGMLPNYLVLQDNKVSIGYSSSVMSSHHIRGENVG